MNKVTVSNFESLAKTLKATQNTDFHAVICESTAAKRTIIDALETLLIIDNMQASTALLEQLQLDIHRTIFDIKRALCYFCGAWCAFNGFDADTITSREFLQEQISRFNYHF